MTESEIAGLWANYAQIFSSLLTVLGLGFGLWKFRKESDASNQAMDKQLDAMNEQIKLIGDQITTSRKLFEINLVTKLEDRFDSERMIAKRRYAAEFLLKNPTVDDPRWDKVSDLLDFFQVVGTLTRGENINKELTYKWFFYWFSHYYTACKEYIKKQRGDDETIAWKDLVDLYKDLEAYDKEINNGKLSNPDKTALEDFFKWELDSLKAHEKYFVPNPYVNDSILGS
jgi:hypothetical protein